MRCLYCVIYNLAFLKKLRIFVRFVRFYTLEEAKDAVRAKNLKVIGNRQINVELSSSTRRNLQTNTDDEGICMLYDLVFVSRHSLDNSEG